MNGARHALVEFGERMGNGLAAGFIVPAVEPDLGALAHILVKRTFAEALEPRRPFGVGQSMLKRVDGERIAESDARGGDGSTGIVDLMPPVEARQRKVDQPRRGLEDQSPVLLEHVEVAPEHVERRADLFRPRLDDAKRFGLLASDDAGDARLEDAGLLAGDSRKRIAQK